MKNKINLLAIVLLVITKLTYAQVVPSIQSLGNPNAQINSYDTLFGLYFNPFSPSSNTVFVNKMYAQVNSSTLSQVIYTVPPGVTYGHITLSTLGLTGMSNLKFNPVFNNGGAVSANSFDNRFDRKLSVSGFTNFDLADYDNNGTMEIALVSASNVYIYGATISNTSEYNYQSIFSYSSLTSGQFIETADLDGNGKQDIICGATSGNKVMIGTNSTQNGVINISNSLSLTTTFTGNLVLCIRDLNNDGKPEIIAGNTTNSTLNIFLNTSDMNSISFATAVSLTPSGTSGGISTIQTDDIDNDQKADILIGNGTSVVVLKNTSSLSSITFSSPVSFLTLNTLPIFTLADLDGDSRNDIVLCGAGNSVVSVFKNNALTNVVSSSSYATRIDLSISLAASAVDIADVNGDGLPDIIASYSTNSNVSLFQNNSTLGTIAFLPQQIKTNATNNPSRLRIGDLNKDGKPDLLSYTNNAGVFSVCENVSGLLKINTVSPSNCRPGDTVNISFSSTYTFGSSNTFTVELSNSTGNFTSPTILNTLSNNSSQGNISFVIPFATALSSLYKIRIIADNPLLISEEKKLIIAEPVQITSLSANTGLIGTNITINGNNFNTDPNSNTVYFGASQAKNILSASQTQLIVRVPKNAGNAPISVTSNGYKGISSEIFYPLFVGAPAINTSLFSSTSFPYLTPTNKNFDLGDLNNNEYPDIIISNGATSGMNCTIVENISNISNINYNGQNTFTTATAVNFSGITDLDGDGTNDVIYVLGTNQLAMIRNNGFRNMLNNPVLLTTANSAAATLAYADLNKDGRMDIVTAGGNNISIFINRNSPGTIISTNFTRTDISVSNAIAAMILEDLDGDGYSDILLTNTTAGSISIIRNTTSGTAPTFSSAVNFTTSTNPLYLTTSDVNKDGKPDLAIVCGSSNMLNIFENISSVGTISSSSLATRVDIALTSGTPVCIASGDLDGDGYPELAFTNSTTNTFSVLKNIYSSGIITATAFAAKVNYTTAILPGFIKINDMNGDEKPDVLVLSTSASNNYPLSSYKNIGGIFTMQPVASLLCNGRTSTFSYTATNTFNTGNTFTLQLSNQNGSFASPINLASKNGTFSDTINAFISSAYVGQGYRVRMVSSNPVLSSNDNQSEFELSSCPELTSIFPNTGFPDSIVRLRGLSFSSIAANNVVYFGSNRAQVISASDTTIDVKVPWGTNFKPVTVTVNKKQTTGDNYFFYKFLGGWIDFDSIKSFAPPVNFNISAGGKTDVADLNADGKTDVVFYNGNNISLFLNTHSNSGRITASSLNLTKNITVPGNYINDLNIVDINNDGFFDLVCWTGFPAGVYIYLNTGTANLFTTPIYIASNYSNNGAVGDLDKDGRLDLVGINGSQVCLFKNNAVNGNINANSFTETYVFNSITTNLTELIVADFNKDKYLDVMISNSNSAYIYRNQKKAFATDMLIEQSSGLGVGANFNTYIMNPNTNGIGVVYQPTSGLNGILRENGCSTTSNIDGFCFGNTTFNAVSNAQYQQFLVADMDGNTELQVVSIGKVANSLRMFISPQKPNSTTTLYYGTEFTVGSGDITGKINGADFDNDGRIDLVFPNTGANGFTILRSEIPTYGVEPDTTATYCTESKFNQKFYAPNVYANNFMEGNQFKLQLSDANGGFTNPVEIGSIAAREGYSLYNNQPSYEIQAKIPSYVPNGDGYKLRLVSTLPVFTSIPSYNTIKIRGCPAIADMIPKNGAPGTVLTLKGSNLSMLPDSFKIIFGTAKGKLLQRTDSTLDIIIPHGSQHGAVQINSATYQLTSPYFFSPNFKGADTAIALQPSITTGFNISSSYTLKDLNEDTKTDVLSNYGSLIRFSPSSITPGGDINNLGFTTSTLFTASTAISKIYKADLDNDGKLDLITINTTNNSIVIYRNTTAAGIPSYGSALMLNTDSIPTHIDFGDINSDGKQDIVFKTKGNGFIRIFLNNSSSMGTISFNPTPRNTNWGSDYLTHIKVADMDGDSKPEIIYANGQVSNQFTSSLSIIKNIANDTGISFIGYGIMYLTNTDPLGLEIADINADGRPDVLVSVINSDSIFMAVNTEIENGRILLKKYSIKVPYNNVSEIEVGELNGDGLNDIALTTNSTSQKNIRLMRNTSSGNTISFVASPTILSSGPFNAENLIISDINNDGLPDLAGGNRGEVLFFKNTRTIAKPSIAASNLIISKNSDSLLNINWTRGNGAQCLVLAKLGSAVNALPLDSVSYQASAIFGSGSQIGSGNYVVYSGPLSQFKLSNISNTNNYHFRVIEFNGDANNVRYLTSNYLSGSTLNNTITGSQSACRNAPLTPFTGTSPTGGNGIFEISWLKSINGPFGLYVLASGKNDTINYLPPSAVNNIWYRRIIKSQNIIDSSNIIQVNISGPKVGFTLNNNNQCVIGNQFLMLDTSFSSSNILTRKWNFGEGVTDTSSIVNPTKSYTNGGSYVIKLSITDNQLCTDSLMKTVQIENKPIAAFSTNKMQQCLNGNSFNFTDTSSNVSQIRLWKISGSNIDTTTLSNFSRSYTNAGTYTIKLIVGKPTCSDSITKTIQVFANPKAGFTINNNSQCLNRNQFNFLDTTVGIINRKWNLGNGIFDTSTIINPSKTYLNANSYTIQLIVNDNNECKDTANKTITVSPKPKAGFTINNPTQCINGNNFLFTDTSSAVTNRKWNFGNGINDTSVISNPTKNYLVANTYTIVLVVKNGNNCSDSAIKTITVNPKPKAGFIINNPTQCINGNNFLFTDTSSAVTNRKWNLGNGINDTSVISNPTKNYLVANTYSIVLVIKNGNNCSDSAIKTITVNPKPKAIVNVIGNTNFCKNVGVNLKASTNSGITYSWLKNGNLITSNNDSNLFVNSQSIYNLIAKNSFNCSDTSLEINTIEYPLPIANFNINNPTQCLNGNNFKFKDSSNILTGSIISREWNFGENENDTTFTIDPNKIYAKASNYIIRLKTTSDNNCKDSITKTITVNASAVAAFKTSDSTQCLTENNFDFTNLSSNSNNQIWSFGDASSSTVLNPTKTYFTIGTFAVKLVAKNNLNCNDSITKTVTVNAQPIIGTIIGNAAPTSITTPFAYSVLSQPNVIYNWTAFNGTIQSGQGTNAVNVVWPTAGTGNLKAEITNKDGCMDSNILPIKITNVGVYELNNTFSNINFKPNPFSNQIEIDFMSNTKEVTQLIIIDAIGKTVFSKNLESNIGNNTFTINELTDLKPGIYFARLANSNGYSKTFKLVKE